VPVLFLRHEKALMQGLFVWMVASKHLRMKKYVFV
jgi:hypothetical protein